MRRLAAVLGPLLPARLLLFFLFVALVLLVPTASNAHADPYPGPDDEVAGPATEQEAPPVEPAAPDVPAECAPPEAPADTAATPPPPAPPPAEGAPTEPPAATAATPPPPAPPPAEGAPPEAPAVASPRSSTPPAPARPSSKTVTVGTGSDARSTATATKLVVAHRGDKPGVTPTRRSWPSDPPTESQTNGDGGDTLSNAAGDFVGRAPSIGQGDPNVVLTLALIALVTAILITVLVGWSKLFPGNTA
jgi:outer membrane biosynthesis protein TonB